MNIFITGTAGFIGYHLADLFLRQGHTVHGYDGITDYYDIRLKQARHQLLRQYPQFTATEALLEEDAVLQAAIDACQPQFIIHLAAQAGVRYSIDNPRVCRCQYRRHIQRHGGCASSQGATPADGIYLLSLWGQQRNAVCRDAQSRYAMSFYAATKKANEAMAHSYAHIYGIPTTMFRFFTVYGPWGRPDMALFKFTKNILEGKPIDIYNHGDMWRDFTYVSDLVRGIALLINVAPTADGMGSPIPNDSLSPVAPWRSVNIGNSHKIRLLDFVEAIEGCLEKKQFVTTWTCSPVTCPPPGQMRVC